MSSLDSYKWQLHKLEERRGRLLRSMRIREANALHADIQEVEKLIKEAEAYDESCKPKPIGQLVSKAELDEMGIIPLMIECHLIADFLTGIAIEVKDICKKHGMTGISFMPSLQKVIVDSRIFAESLMKINDDYEDLIARNDTLCDALHKKCIGYIGRKLDYYNKKHANNQ